MLLVGRLDFEILLSEMHIMSKFRFKLESRSFSILKWKLSEEVLRVVQPSFVLLLYLY